MRRLAPAAIVLAIALAMPSPGVGAPPPPVDPATLILEIHPGGGAQRTGDPQTLDARVALANNDGVDGVVVDFEVTEGPGDDDIGTAGNTPETPDMSCTTAGGSTNHPASCTVQYTEQDNQGGSDAVLAWIDADSLDATVEADLAEGENQHAAGAGGCSAGSRGPGLLPEPDQTDCVEKRWIARVPLAIDLEAETGSAVVGSSGSVDASVFDQFGNLFDGRGSATTVSLELLAGSVNDPGDGSDFGSPDLGSCDTGTTGRCSLTFGSTNAGLDLLCGYVPGESAACSEQFNAPELANGADVVQRMWQPAVPSPPDPDPPPAPAPPAPDSPPAPPALVVTPPGAAASPDEPGTGPPASGDEKPVKRGDGTHGGGKPAPAPADEPAPPSDPPAVSQPATTAPVAGHGLLAEAQSLRRAHAHRAASKRHGSTHRRATRERRRAAATAGHRAAAGRRPAASERAQRDRRRAEHARGRIGRRIGELSQVAVKTAERFSFPLSLALFVLFFMAVQGRIDRRDPKLRLAPLDSKHDLATFA